MIRLVSPKSFAFLWMAAWLSGAALGCTTKTIIVPPDSGPRIDAQVEDAGAAEDVPPLPPPVIDTCTPDGIGATIGRSCTADAACDDGCYCNGDESCQDGVCAAGIDPCPDTIYCTDDVCLEEADRCFHDPRHEVCSNGDACDGIELCDLASGCITGAPPYCNDDDSCTIDSCDTSVGCVFAPRDLDGDGYRDGHCGGDDCDDDPRYGGPDIHPGATEDCANRRDDDCDGLRDYNDLDCIPTNDACDSPIVLPGPGTYSGATRGLGATYTLSCRSTSGPDAVFRFSLTEPQDVTVTLSGGGSGTAIALRPWAQCDAGPDDRCTAASPPVLLAHDLPIGDYAIIVQSTSSGGAFDLTLRFGPPTPVPPVDVCNAETEDLCDAGHAACDTSAGPIDATVTGVFLDVADDYTPGCSSSGRRDAVYQFTLDSPKDVTLTASAGTSGSTYLALTTDCATSDAELRCVSGSGGSGAVLRHRELGPGTYFVILESSNGSAPMWSLHAVIEDPAPRNAGDACSTAIDISEAVEGGGGSGMVSLSTLEFDSGTACGGTSSSYRDASFVFELGSTRDVTLTTSDSTTWVTYYTTLQTTCGDSTSSLRCWSGSSMRTQSWRSLPAGRYYVTASTSDTSGTFTASIVTGPPTPIPPNDRCSGAIELTNGTSRTDTTIGFEDDAPGGSCASSSMPDAFYTFTLAARSNVILSVRDADPGSTTFYLTLRDACGSGTSLACNGGSPATINTMLEPGTYYLQVETYSTDTSDYQILATFFPA